MSTSLRSMRSIVAGDLVQARKLTDRAWAIATVMKLPQPYDVVWRCNLDFPILRETGKLSEWEDFASEHVDTFFESASHSRFYRTQLHLACVLKSIQAISAENSAFPGVLLSRNRELVAEIAVANDYQHAASTRFTLVHLAEASSILSDGPSAALLYKALESQGHLVATIGGAFMCVGSVSRYLGLLATVLERWEDAERHFRDALEMNDKIGAPIFAARTRLNWADMLLKRGRPGDRQRTSELLGHVAAVASELNLPVLGEETEQLRLKLEGLLSAGAQAMQPAQTLHGLSLRETEVLRLVARGHSNRQIADQLYISVRTVDNHVASILNKLGVPSRSAATRVAFECGINRE